MKKILILFLFITSFSFSAMKDGIYYAEKRFDNNWTSFIKMTVKNEKIIGIVYDRKNNNTGGLLSINQSENNRIKQENGENFKDISLKLSRTMVNTQNIQELKTINNSAIKQDFVNILNYLLEKAEKGETGEFTIK